MSPLYAKSKNTPMVGIVVFVFLFSWIPPTSAAENTQVQVPSRLESLPDFAPLAEKLAPVVVNISATQAPPARTAPRARGRRQPSPQPFGDTDPFGEFWRRFFGQPFGPEEPDGGSRTALGSGVIMDIKGLILTNNHVVENADKITVKLSDEREFNAKVMGRDPKTDVAVIQITNAHGEFPVAPLGDSSKLRVGNWVVAMGSPFGLANTLTVGVVSAKGRQIGAGPYDNFIQTDASINPGNSGGPLVNLRGEVVGINTAIFSQTGGNLGIGFAIPINLAKDILPELIKTGKVTRGWLGVSIQPVTPQLAESLGLEKSRGALVASVSQGGPADEAGIKVGDVIVEYNGTKIDHANQLPILVAQTEVGKNANVVVWRDNKRIPLTAKIGKLKEEEVVASGPQKGKLGMTVQNLTPELAETLGLDRSEGIVITSVEPGSAADEAGLRQGDVILEVNRKKITDAGEFRKIVDRTKPNENLLFLLRRGSTNLFLALKSPAGRG